jgi:hypothetical protein
VPKPNPEGSNNQKESEYAIVAYVHANAGASVNVLRFFSIEASIIFSCTFHYTL